MPTIQSEIPMPIIVGVPRSGTTLLRLMLDAHSELAVTHEAGFIPLVANLSNPLSRVFYQRFSSSFKNGRWPALSRKNNIREDLYSVVTALKTWNDFHIPREEFKQALMQLEPFSVAGGVRVFFRLYAARFGKSRWGDKTPFYTQHLETVERILPEAHFIHIIRDGRDAAVSGKGLPFVGGDIERIGANWSRQIRKTRGQSGACRHYLEIRYEDLILNTTNVLKEICDFIKLRYEPDMESYHLRASERMNELENTYDDRGNVVVRKDDRLLRHQLTSKPPEPARIGRWKTAMSADELSRFNRVAGQMLQELGYEK
ncbi:MAG TPA: sulfotransferase [Pyrinomonadaceae bacterium]|nr:sulfotransferase [Pyrinomonadaceae bacterium]